MQFKPLDPFTLVPNPWNSNKVGRAAFDKLKLSLTAHGAFKPIVVRELPDGSLQIIGGFHRNEAAKELGWESVPVVNLGSIPDSQAKEISLIDNTRYGEDDKELLEKLLSEIEDISALEAVLPADELIELPDGDTLIDEVMKEAKEDGPETVKTLKFKLDIDKAEEVEAVLSAIAYDNDYKYADGISNFGEALYHALVIEKK